MLHSGAWSVAIHGGVNRVVRDLRREIVHATSPDMLKVARVAQALDHYTIARLALREKARARAVCRWTDPKQRRSHPMHERDSWNLHLRIDRVKSIRLKLLTSVAVT